MTDQVVKLKRILGCLLILAAVMFVWASVDIAVEAKAVREAKAFCEACIPQIDAVKEKTGRHPQSLLELRPPSAEPEMLKGTKWYDVDGSGYMFVIWRRRESIWTTLLPWVYYYESTSREWRGSTG